MLASKHTFAVFMSKTASSRRSLDKKRPKAFKEAQSADPSRALIELRFCMWSFEELRQIFRCEHIALSQKS